MNLHPTIPNGPAFPFGLAWGRGFRGRPRWRHRGTGWLFLANHPLPRSLVSQHRRSGDWQNSRPVGYPLAKAVDIRPALLETTLLPKPGAQLPTVSLFILLTATLTYAQS